LIWGDVPMPPQSAASFISNQARNVGYWPSTTAMSASSAAAIEGRPAATTFYGRGSSSPKTAFRHH